MVAEKTPVVGGGALRQTRLARGWTLADVAARADLSVAFLSRLERGHASSSLSNLIRLSGVLEVPLERLFSTGATPGRVARDGYVLRRGSEGGALSGGVYRYKPLAGGLPHHAIRAFELEYPPGKGVEAAPYSHEGEEVLYCLEGKIEFTVGSERFTLRPGDCVQFDGRQPHGGRNPGKVRARMLMIVGGHVGSPASLPLCAPPADGPSSRTRPAAGQSKVASRRSRSARR